MHRENSGQRPPSQLSFIFCTYIGSSFKYPCSCVLFTIFTSSIFTSKLRVAVHKSQNAAITSDLNHRVSQCSWPSPKVIMRLACDSQLYHGRRSIVSLESQRTRAKREKFTRHVIVRSVKETRFDKASEPNQTKSRTIALRYDAPFYRLYY